MERTNEIQKGKVPPGYTPMVKIEAEISESADNEAPPQVRFPKSFMINTRRKSLTGCDYWSHDEGDCLFLAFFDCQEGGHVANMVKRIYKNTLHKLVVDFNIHFPGSLLQFLGREIHGRFKSKAALQHYITANFGLLKIDKENRSIDFAGAGMNLIKEDQDNIHILRGDKFQIGERTKHKYQSLTIDAKVKACYHFQSQTDFQSKQGLEVGKVESAYLTALQLTRHLSLKRREKALLDYFQGEKNKKNLQEDILSMCFEY